MYVGWGLLHLGTAPIVGSAWMLATFPQSATWLHRQVLQEERRLGGAFGEEFRRWQATVPRYVGFRRLQRAP
jgi:protein-S-isoprenylcysteine O-methyltransferase Ste14